MLGRTGGMTSSGIHPCRSTCAAASASGAGGHSAPPSHTNPAVRRAGRGEEHVEARTVLRTVRRYIHTIQ